MLFSTGYQYYSSISTLYVQPKNKVIFIGKHRWILTYEPQKEGDDCLISMEDLERLFSPDLKWTEQEGRIELQVPGIKIRGIQDKSMISIEKEVQEKRVCKQVDMGVPFRYIEGRYYIPVQGFFASVCGANRAKKEPFYMISDVKTDINQKQDWLYMDQIIKSRKKYGYFYEAVWFEPAKRIVPYQLYVPSAYKADQPSKLIVALHGANSDHHAVFERSDGKLARMAEKRGYIVLAVNGLFYRSFYGYCWPTSGGVNSSFKGNKDNPLELTKLQQEQRRISQECVMEQIRQVMSHYNIDQERIYMMGNSMGGAGTVWLANQYPEMFRAISPSGGNVSPDYIDAARIKEIPILFVVGTEDEFGAYYQDEAAERFAKAGCDYQICHVGGGDHSYGWTHALRETFDFFDHH